MAGGRHQVRAGICKCGKRVRKNVCVGTYLYEGAYLRVRTYGYVGTCMYEGAYLRVRKNGYVGTYQWKKAVRRCVEGARRHEKSCT